MRRALDPIPVLRIAVAGWMNQHHLLAIDYLCEENRILREQLGTRHMKVGFTGRAGQVAEASLVAGRYTWRVLLHLKGRLFPHMRGPGVKAVLKRRHRSGSVASLDGMENRCMKLRIFQ
jgi:hypothetical protein